MRDQQTNQAGQALTEAILAVTLAALGVIAVTAVFTGLLNRLLKAAVVLVAMPFP